MINGGFVQLPSFVLVRTSPFSNDFMGSLPDGRVTWEAFHVACQVGGQNDANEATNRVFLDIERCHLSFNFLKKERKKKTPLREKSKTFPLMFKFIPFSVSAEQMERLVYGEHKLKILLMQLQKKKKSTSA